MRRNVLSSLDLGARHDSLRRLRCQVTQRADRIIHTPADVHDRTAVRVTLRHEKQSRLLESAMSTCATCAPPGSARAPGHCTPGPRPGNLSVTSDLGAALST